METSSHCAKCKDEKENQEEIQGEMSCLFRCAGMRQHMSITSCVHWSVGWLVMQTFDYPHGAPIVLLGLVHKVNQVRVACKVVYLYLETTQYG